MPTNTDKIDELSNRVTTIAERLENVRKETEGLAELAVQITVHSERIDVLRKTTDVLVDMSNRIAVLEQQIKDLKEKTDETSRRRWSVFQITVGAIIGGIITLAITLVKYLLP